MGSDSSPRDVRLYTEKRPSPPPCEACASGALPEVLRAFYHLTGRRLRYVPAEGSQSPIVHDDASAEGRTSDPPRGRLVLDALATGGMEGASNDSAIRDLASALDGLLGELSVAQYALWQREAELATAIPFVPHADETEHLAARLEAVLHRTGEAIGCDAAALYLLDDATTSLKLRSSWGLPRDRLIQTPRDLKGALADLESMLGHAVVLEDDRLARYWNPPEDFVAGVCVPVSTPTQILGTVWFFADNSREFSDRDTHVAEMAAGRIAADLEREVLRQETLAAVRMRQQVHAGERLQRNQLPSIPPILEGWDIAASTLQADGIGGDFHDWFTLPDGSMAIAVGHMMDSGIEAALAVSAVKAALRTHGQYQQGVVQLLEQVNSTVWMGSSGEQFGSLFCGQIDERTADLRFAVAGQLGILRVADRRWKSLARRNPLLGSDIESTFSEKICRIVPGETVVVLSEGARRVAGRTASAECDAALAAVVGRNASRPARDLIALVRETLAGSAHAAPAADTTIMIIKRRAT